MGSPVPDPLFQSIQEQQEPTLEDILLDKGWITREQLAKAQELQAAEESRGQKVRLGQVLVHLGAVTPVQVRQALLLQGKTPMRCAPCNRNYNIKGLKPGRRALCKICRAPLVSLVAADDLHADDADAGAHQVPVGESVDASVAHLIPGYEIERELGAGGMGHVYLARQKTLDRLVAVKLIAPKLLTDEEVLKRFLKEARAAARVRHENIVRAIDAGEVNGRHYFVMEYMDGRTLADVIRTDGQMPESRALELARQVAAGLQHAQHQGLIHGDIKPSNIILGTDGIARICDFGLVRDAAPEKNEAPSGTVLGTRAYASPEHRRDDAARDHRSDIYSFGVTLYEMVTGRLPFDPKNGRPMAQQAADGPPPPQTLVPALSGSTSDLILRMVRYNPADRFPDYRSLLEALEAAMKPFSARAKGPALRKNVWRWAAAVAVVAACGVILLRRDAPVAERPSPSVTRVNPLLAEVRRLEADATGRPGQSPAVLARWKELVEQFRGKPDHGAFAAGYLEFQSRREAEADKSAQSLLDQSNLHALARRTVEAIRALDLFPSGYEGTDAATAVATRKAALDKELEERYEEGKQAVATCVAGGSFVEAHQSLEALKGTVSFPGPDGPRYLNLRHREELIALHRSIEEEHLVAKRREGLETPPQPPAKEAAVAPLPPPPPAAQPPAPPALVRAPIPRESLQKASEKSIRELFKQDYEKAPAGARLAFARRLLTLAGQTRDDVVGRFVLFREARDLAAQAGDATLAFQAIDAMAVEFDVPDLAMKIGALATTTQSAMTAQACKDAATAYLALSEEAALRENADGVEKAAAQALQFARRAKDVPLVARADARIKEAADLRESFGRLLQAREALAVNPEDAENNLFLGRHLCFTREEWALGLRYLRKGSDPALRGLSEKELARPQETAAQVDLGDAWWDRADGEPERTAAALRRHAATWYEAAREQLTGVEKVRIDSRLGPPKSK